MSFDGFDDELWDEYRWEAHLDEVEKKSEQLRKFISSDQKGSVPRWITLLKESLSEDDAFEAFVEEELLLDEAYFPEDEDWEEEDDFEEEDFLFGEYDEDELDGLDDEVDDFDAGEEWKSLSDDYTLSDYGSLDNLKLFNDARVFAVDVLKWAETVPTKHQNAAFLEFVSDSLKIAAKLAGGYSFGFEPEYLGGNIAYTKKALKFANHSLDMIQELKGTRMFNKLQYAEFHARLFELRNDVGVYIQDLRDRFYGID